MKWLFIALTLLATPAFAEDSPQVQSLRIELGRQLSDKLECSAAFIAAQKRIKELEEKYESKEKPDAKQKP